MTTEIIDGITIDTDTGEILDDVPGDQLEWLTQRFQEAKLNITGWEQRQGIVKTAIDKLLSEAGVKSVKTKYGTPTEMNGRESVDRAKVTTLLDDREIGPDQEMDFHRTVCNGMNASKLKDWLTANDMFDDIAGVLRVGKGYVQVNPPAAPAPERAEVTA